MRLLPPAEFDALERLLADLLPHCEAREEAALLQLHTRLEAIFASQKYLPCSKERLTALQSRTVR